jgi:hypothetical protein
MTTLSRTIAPQLDPRFKLTFFLVEANTFERDCLRKEWQKRVEWEEDNSGYIGQVGILADRPVNISVFWARIEGNLVAFWDSPSQVVDHEMIQKWLTENCLPPQKGPELRSTRCNATNFYVCIQAIQKVAAQNLWE